MALPFSKRRPDTEPSDAKKESPGSFLRSLAVIALLAWLLRSLIVAPFSIPTGSMLPTMMMGDHLFVSKWPYGYSSASFPWHVPSFAGRVLGSNPDRGDVAVFVGPEGADVVKRVIGLPGDLIAVENGVLSINGRPVPRQRIADYAMPVSPNSPCRVQYALEGATRRAADGGTLCLYPAYRETLPEGVSYVTLDQADGLPGDNFGPVVVPEGHVFMMGDNRDDSADSRFSPSGPIPGMGFIPMDRLVGRAERAYWSTDGSASLIKPWTWFSALRSDRLGYDYNP